MPKYEVVVEFSGYVRGNCTLTVEADSEEEALQRSRYINDKTVNIVREDIEIVDKYIIGVLE